MCVYGGQGADSERRREGELGRGWPGGGFTSIPSLPHVGDALDLGSAKSSPGLGGLGGEGATLPAATGGTATRRLD